MWLPGSGAQYRLKPAEGYEVQVCIYRFFNRILFFFGQRSFMRNKTQTVVIIIAIKRMLENKVHLLHVLYVSTYIFKSDC